jgi:hypothetical protein
MLAHLRTTNARNQSGNAVVVQDVCWGSWNGPHTNDVPLLDIAELSLRVNVSGYAPEMANLATSRNGVFAIR